MSLVKEYINWPVQFTQLTGSLKANILNSFEVLFCALCPALFHENVGATKAQSCGILCMLNRLTTDGEYSLAGHNLIAGNTHL